MAFKYRKHPPMRARDETVTINGAAVSVTQRMADMAHGRADPTTPRQPPRRAPRNPDKNGG